MVSMSELKTRAGQALRTLTHHRAAGPVLGALAILLVARYGPVPTPLSAPMSLSRDAATAAGPPQSPSSIPVGANSFRTGRGYLDPIIYGANPFAPGPWFDPVTACRYRLSCQAEIA
jgi:hypothetical protein